MLSANEQTDLKVSVIIPTYNRAGYLREALHSVLRQSLTPWEVIVVDDGSTDDTRQVIQDAPGSICYFEQAHQGVAAARNLGLEKATGDLIAWLDSDDLWEPDFLAAVVPILARDETLAGVYTGITMVDADGVRLRSSTRTEPPEALYEALIRGNFLATPSVVVRKACYDTVGHFDTQLPISEDYDMWLRLTAESRLVGIPRPLAQIRVHRTNMMSDTDALCQARLILLGKHFGPLPRDGNVLSESSRIAYGYAFRAIAIQYIENGRPDRGWRYLAQAAAMHPPILAELDTFYELALGDQPRGYRGDATQLDIPDNGAEMLGRMDALFASADSQIQAMREEAYGNAYLALAMLSDQTGEWRFARHYMLCAARAHPDLLQEYDVVRRLIKLFLGKRVIGWLRRINRHKEAYQYVESEV